MHFYLLPAMTVLEYHFSRSARKGPLIVISGRKEGLLAQIMSLIGLGGTISFEVSKTTITRQMHSIGSTNCDQLPVNHCASTVVGTTRNIAYLPVMISAFAGGIGAMFERTTGFYVGVGLCLLALVFLLMYFTSTRLFIMVETFGGRTIGIRFKKSSVGRDRLDKEETQRIAGFLHALASGAPIEEEPERKRLAKRDDYDDDDDDDDDR